MITVFSDGKLNDNISANMYYNDLTKYYGDFNCELVNFVHPNNANTSSAYLYVIIDSENDLETRFFFRDDHNFDLSMSPTPE